MINNAQIRQFNALLSKLSLQDETMKRGLILEATRGRSDRTKNMTVREAKALINYLNGYNAQGENRMRRKILHYCHLMEWYKPGTKDLDFDRIDRFCLKFGYAHRKLNQYSKSELPTLVTQFEEVYKHFITKDHGKN